MPRRNTGAKLQWREDRGAYYITWTERGRSFKRSTTLRTAAKLKQSSPKKSSDGASVSAQVIRLKSL